MSLLTWLTGYDSENAQRAAEADARLRQLNADAAASGRYDQRTVDQITADYATQFDTNPDTIGTAFDEGWQEGRQNVSGFISGAINRIVADPLRAVIGGLPWWLWLLALGALAFYLWPLLRPIFRRLR